MNTASNSTRIYSPVEIVFCKDAVSKTGSVCKNYGKNALIATMQSLIDIDLLNNLLASLKRAKINCVIFSKVNSEPTCEEIDAAGKILKKSKIDLIIGVGGGSCMDFAKALAILANHPKDVWSYVDLSNKPPDKIDPKKVLPVITIPTSSGTGSEVTPFAVAKNTKTVQKGTIKNHAIFPKVTIIDPKLTTSVPKNLTASIGVDALSHMLENYFNVERRNPYSDALVEEGLKRIIKYLPIAYRNGENLQARTEVAWASALAGIANANAGTTVVHALSHPAGARLQIPHGISVAMFLVAVMKKTIYLEYDRASRISQIFGLHSRNLTRGRLAENIINFLDEVLTSINMTPKLSEYSQDRKYIEIIVDDALSYMSRPIKQHVKVFTRKELENIVNDSF